MAGICLGDSTNTFGSVYRWILKKFPYYRALALGRHVEDALSDQSEHEPVLDFLNARDEWELPVRY